MKSLNPNSDGARRSQRIQIQHDSDDQDDSEEEVSSEDNSSDDGDESEGNDIGQEMEEISDGEGDDAEQNDEEEEGGDDDEEQEDISVKGASKAKPGGDTSSAPTKGAKVSAAKADISKSLLVPGHSELDYTMDELVQNTIMYLLLQHNKKTPIKRPDIQKNAMNSQKCFAEVMDKIQVIFEERFGIELVGVEPKARTGGYSSYILVSKYQMSATQSAISATPEQEMKSTILLILLALTFMLSRPIEEDIIWRVLTDLHLTSVCKKKDDLRAFLKREYVSTLFLKSEENKETDCLIVRYDWGLRAMKEFSRYWVLKFVTRLFPEKKPYDFTIQYNLVLEIEKDIVEADRAEMEANEIEDDDNDEDGPSQKMTFHGDGTSEIEFRDGTEKSPSRNMDSLSLQNSAPSTPGIPEAMDVDGVNVGRAEGGEDEEHEARSQCGSGSESSSGSGSGSNSSSESESD